jgi:hypothetical protein
MARDGSQAADRLGEPGWVASLLFAAVATALVCWPVWPGMMSYDSLFAYEQARYGVQTMLWPPLHTYMFQLSEAVGARTWGVFLFQTFTLFAAAAVIVHLVVRSRGLAAALCLAFAAMIALSPAVLGPMLVHWRDVPTASFAFLGVAFWLLAARYRQPLLLAPAAAAFGCAVALRYNAFALVAFLLALLVWSPLLGRPSRLARPFAILCLAAALGLAWASTQWRLPDLLKMPSPGNFSGTQQFDLIGISACADKDYIPDSVTNGPISPYHIRKNYDPRHLHLSLQTKPGVQKIYETDGGGQVQKAWLPAVLAEPGCYLSHRMAVFVEQMGVSDQGLFYPTHVTIDRNSFGLAPAHPQAAQLMLSYVTGRADDLWRRPAWLYVLALALGGAAMLRSRAQAPLLGALLLGAFAYPGLLFVASPAADARYIFPSNVAAALIIALSAGLLLSGGTSKRR